MIKLTLTFSEKRYDGRNQDEKHVKRLDAILVKERKPSVNFLVGKSLGNRDLVQDIDEIKNDLIILSNALNEMKSKSP